MPALLSPLSLSLFVEESRPAPLRPGANSENLLENPLRPGD